MAASRRHWSSNRKSARWSAVGIGLVLGLTTLAAVLPANADDPTPVGLVGKGPRGEQTEPVFDVKKAIEENVWVESSVDSDGDGVNDRIGVRIRRPNTTAAVPGIINASPYNRGTRTFAWVNDYLTELGIDVFGEEIEPPPMPYSPNFFLARGYAVIEADMAGTGTSTGCPSTGGEPDVAGIKAVVQWLTGDATAYTDRTGGDPVTATWSTGNSALIGVSYEGTLPTGVATTGVDGLKTIVPIAAISSWYNYFRANGAVKTGYFDPLAGGVLTRDPARIKVPNDKTGDDYRACDDEIIQVVKAAERRTGNYNAYWDARNYLNDVDDIDASVFLVHGLTDWNVQSQHFGQLWNELKQYDVPRKLWLHRGAHTSPANIDNARWEPVLHRWFDHWLYGLDTGVMAESTVDVQSVHPPFAWQTYANWPVPASAGVNVYLTPSDGAGPGGLTATQPADGAVREAFTESYTVGENALVRDAFEPRTFRRVYLSPVLTQDVHLSGTPWVQLEARLSGNANVSAVLMDYAAENSAEPEGNLLVSRGWMDVKSLQSLWEEDDIRAQRNYVVNFEQMPKDYVFQAGRRIGVVVTGKDNRIFAPDGANPATIELAVNVSHIRLPIVGGRPGLGF